MSDLQRKAVSDTYSLAIRVSPGMACHRDQRGRIAVQNLVRYRPHENEPNGACVSGGR